jgi:drug/metabolite transporter (DMT)-like permease
MNNHNHTTLPKGRDIPLLLMGIFGIGSSGPLVAKSAMSIPTIIFFRNLGGALIMAPFAFMNGEWKVAANRRAMMLSGVAGVLLGIHFIVFFAAMRFTSVATGTALAAMQPIFAALYMKFKGAKISTRSFAGMFIALLSLFLITGVDFSLSTRAFMGDLFGISSGAFAAAYVIIGSNVQKTISTSTYTTMCYTFCALTGLIAALVTGSPLFHFPAVQWLYLAGLLLGAQVLGHTLFNLTLKRVSPVVVSLLVFFEVPVAGFIAWIWLNQKPPLGTVPGIIGLLLGCAIFVMPTKSIDESPDRTLGNTYD